MPVCPDLFVFGWGWESGQKRRGLPIGNPLDSVFVILLLSNYAIASNAVASAVASNGVNAYAVAVNGLSLSGLVTTRSERNSNYSCENKS